MRVLVIGANGTIGKHVVAALRPTHEVVEASRKGAVKVDLSDSETIDAMYRKVGSVDAVVCTAGSAPVGSLTQMNETAYQQSFRSKLLGQINLVRLGIDYVNDEGSFTLISGVWGRSPRPGACVIAPTNAGVDGFVRAAALELPRKIRVNAVSPPLVRETAVARGLGNHGLPAADVARAFVTLITGEANGTTVYPGD